MKVLMKALVCAFSVGVGPVLLAAGGVALTNELAVLTIDGQGRSVSLVERKSGRELLSKPTPAVAVRASAGSKASCVCREEDGRLVLSFPDVEGAVVLAVESFGLGWTFTVEDCPKDVSELRFGGFACACAKWRGKLVNGVSDERSAVVLRAYDCDNVMTPVSVSYSDSFVGRRFGLVAAPRTEILPALKRMTEVSGAPVSRCGGAWALDSELTRGSYLQPTLKYEATDDWIELAKRGGFSFIHFRQWMESFGSYPARTNLYPRGDADFFEASRRIRAAGLRTGFHTLTGCISPDDAWSATALNTNFLAWTTYTLAAPLAEEATELMVEECPIARHHTAYTSAGNGNMIRIGTEILQYSGIVRERPYRFTGLRRGAFGTKPSAHAKGAKAAYLQQRYKAFYPAVDSPVADLLADRLAEIRRQGDFDMVYFDGAEGMGLVDKKLIGKMREKLYHRLDHDMVVESSCTEPQNWWFRSRLGSWDDTGWDPKAFADLHFKDVQSVRDADFLNLSMGWWNIKDWNHDSRGQRSDELEYFMLKNAAHDSACSIVGLDVNDRPLSLYRDNLFTLLGWYERFRLARAFAPGVRERILPAGAEFALRQDETGRWTLAPRESRKVRVRAGEPASMTFSEARPARLRVEALATGGLWDDKGMVTLIDPATASFVPTNAPGVVFSHAKGTHPVYGGTLKLSAKNVSARQVASWSGVRHRFAPEDAKCNRAFGVWVKGDGSGALLDIRPSCAPEYSWAIGDYFVRLDFTGWKYVELSLAERDPGLADKLEWPTKIGYYPRYHRGYNYDHIRWIDFFLHDVPKGRSAEVELSAIRSRHPLENKIVRPRVTLNGHVERLPFDLATFDFAELEEGVWTHYDRYGNLLGRHRSSVSFVVSAGRNEICLDAERPSVGSARAELTVLADGRPFPALDEAAAAKDTAGLLAYEGVPDIPFAPAKGADGRATVRTRPGETANLSFVIRGPVSKPVLHVGAATCAFPVSLAASERLVMRNGRDWKKLDARRKVVASGSLSARIASFTGAIEVSLISDDASADARLELAKNYVRPKTALDPMVPFMYQAGDPAKMVEAMKRLRRDFGLRRFVFTSPGLLRYFGRADKAEHERIGKGMAWAKEQLADTDIEIGWWDYPTFRGGLHEEGQHILDADGNKSDALCPLDAHAHDAFLANLKTAAKIGRPSVYFLEDDFTLANHGGMNQMRGCFCPLHLEALEKRIGKRFSAKELASFFEKPTKANEPVRRAFADVSRESLVQLAKRIRAAADEVDPSVQIGLCQSGFVDQDGDTTEPIARALAGRTRPLVRVYGSRYSNENSPAELPCGTAHTFWSGQHLPKDFEHIHESDPYPHTRFYNSARFYISEICAAFMAGMGDSFLYCTRYSDDPIRDTGYAQVFADYRQRLEAVKAFRLRSQVVGVRAVYDPAEAYLARVENGVVTFGSIEEIAYFLGKFGFPMTTLDAPVQVMFGATAKHLTDAQLEAALSRGLLLDADCALTLVERGFGDLLGCDVREDPALAFVYEHTLPVDGVTRGGVDSCYHKRTLNAPIILSRSVRYARLSPKLGTETWAQFEDLDRRSVSPSFVYAKNARGGRIGIFAYSLKGNRRQYVFNPEKQELVAHFFDRASGGALDVSATQTPCTWLSAAVSDDGREMLVMVNDLAGEPRDDVVLNLAARWKGATVSRLAADGSWQTIGRASDRFRLPFVCEPMVPEFVRFEVR